MIDSHTEGEPTRVVLDVPPLKGETLVEKTADFRDHHNGFRTGSLLEPRGSEAVVGALLLEPFDAANDCAVIYFNNATVLGMCGHGTIGLVRTLQFMGRIQPGTVRIETPVGLVQAVLATDGLVTIKNVPSYRYRTGVTVHAAGFGDVTGDIAYGGNWFFLAPAGSQALDLANLDTLTRLTTAIRRGLEAEGITGENDGVIDHIELYGPAGDSANDARNFVLCPGLAYDRSPCGTGTSAKLACLAADGHLAPDTPWRQESVIGSLFVGKYSRADDGRHILPRVSGRAYVTAEATLVFDPEDPFREGIQA